MNGHSAQCTKKASLYTGLHRLSHSLAMHHHIVYKSQVTSLRAKQVPIPIVQIYHVPRPHLTLTTLLPLYPFYRSSSPRPNSIRDFFSLSRSTVLIHLPSTDLLSISQNKTITPDHPLPSPWRDGQDCSPCSDSIISLDQNVRHRWHASVQVRGNESVRANDHVHVRMY